jgi:membrane protein implicated in regulation of membrane protease activity
MGGVFVFFVLVATVIGIIGDYWLQILGIIAVGFLVWLFGVIVFITIPTNRRYQREEEARQLEEEKKKWQEEDRKLRR